MKNPLSLSKVLALGSLVALAGSYAGCKEPDSEMYIRGVLSWPTTGDCLLKADPDAAQLLEGQLDVGLSNEYRAVLLVANQLVQTDRAPDEKQRTETSRVSIHTAEVVLSVPGNCADGLCEVSSFSLPASGAIDNSTGGRPGYGLVYVTLIDSVTAKKSAGKILTAQVRVYGRALGGQEVRSNDFQFNIRVGSGQLIYFDPAYDDPLIPGIDCLKDQGSSGGSAALSTTCVLGQDGPTHCALCAGNNVNCRCQDPSAAKQCEL